MNLWKGIVLSIAILIILLILIIEYLDIKDMRTKELSQVLDKIYRGK